MEPGIWDRQNDESDNAWCAFQDYRGMPVGSGRSIELLLAYYTEQSAKGATVPTTKQSTLHTWSCRYSWSDRCRAWDARQDKLRAEAQAQVASEEHKARLEEFRRFTENMGRGQINVVMKGTRILNQFMDTVDPNKMTVAEANGMARAIASISDSATKMWAQALGVEKLLEALVNGDDSKE